jgi:hypothetical protein
MQDLHRDPPARVVHRIGDPAVMGDVPVVNRPAAPGNTPPSAFGAMPPVTIRPAPPAARAA